MSASFGERIATKLKDTSSVWSVDAVFEDRSGNATFTKSETEELTRILSKAGTLFQRTKANVLNEFANNKALNERTNRYINLKVRDGSRVDDPKGFIIGLQQHIHEYYQKEADKVKQQKSKDKKFALRDAALKVFTKSNQKQIEQIFTMYNLLVDAKLLVIDKLNNVDGLRTLLKTKDGFEVTGQEGFVAIDHLGKGSLKLVDRLNFSKANFSTEYIKGWQK
jgi:hypothetical protein